MKTTRTCMIGIGLLLTACTISPPQTAAPTSTRIPAPSSTASPSPTTIATATRTITPAPTPTHPPPVEPLATASVINFAGWSPDSRWVAYWTYTWEEIDAMPDHGGPFDYPPGTLHFADLASGAACEYPHPASLLWSRPVFAWQEDGRAVVLADDGIVRVGMPCAEETETLADLAALITLRDPSLSPDHAHRVEIVELEYDWEVTGDVRVAVIITDSITGEERNRLEADINLFLGEVSYGEWVSETWYFVYKSKDFGPLLLTTNGETIQVLPEFFPDVDCELEDCTRSMVGFFAPSADGQFHILLAHNEFDLFLYHSESGEVETLPYDFTYWEALSPRGQWALMLDDFTEDAILWARAVDPAGSGPVGLGKGVWLVEWSPDEERVAFESQQGDLRVESFPEREILESWDFSPADWSPWSLNWSPDGASLAVTIWWFNEEQKAELYILENFGAGVKPAPGATP